MADSVSSPHPSTYPTPLAPPQAGALAGAPTVAERQKERQQQQHATTPGGQRPADASAAAQLARLQLKLRSHIRQFPDFPSPGILFEDVFPLFHDPGLHADLILALELFVSADNGGPGVPDVVVGLDARGFLFGPSLALRLGSGFAPVRKSGKLPGPTEKAAYSKEYGEDNFEMQADAIKPGQRVLVLDDIIATGKYPIPSRREPCAGSGRVTFATYPSLVTPSFSENAGVQKLIVGLAGGSAAAAGTLVEKLGGKLLGYVFLLELKFLKGRNKLTAPAYTLFSGQEGTENIV